MSNPDNGAIGRPAAWAELRYPWQRSELLLYLDQLATPDPRPLWAAERQRGLISDIDQVVHFFFDDHAFDADCIGISLFGGDEVAVIRAVMASLSALMDRLPADAGDDEFVTHPLWPAVTRSAITAAEVLRKAG